MKFITAIFISFAFISVHSQTNQISEWQSETMELCQEILDYAEPAPLEESKYVIDITRQCFLSVERMTSVNDAVVLASLVTEKKKVERAKEIFQRIIDGKKESMKLSIKEIDTALNSISNPNMITKGTRLKDHLRAILKSM